MIDILENNWIELLSRKTNYFLATLARTSIKKINLKRVTKWGGGAIWGFQLTIDCIEN